MRGKNKMQKYYNNFPTWYQNNCQFSSIEYKGIPSKWCLNYL